MVLDPHRAEQRSTGQHLLLIAKGFCMGAADVVPGVSGGTMALILGIYEELIRSIRSFDATFFTRVARLRLREAAAGVAWPFVLCLGSGILTAVFTLARSISWTLENHPVFIWSFFFGLVLASVWSVGRHMDRWNAAMVAWAAIGCIGAYWLVGMVPMRTPEAPWFVFLSGAVAICAMILPGISGSFILVLMGKYHYILDAVNHRDLPTLAVFVMGVGLGLICFVRLLGWFLARYRRLTLAMLTGLMLGSLRKIWPWKLEGTGPVEINALPPFGEAEVWWAVALMSAGILIVLGIETMARGRNHGGTRA